MTKHGRIGGSSIAYLMVAFGLASPESAPRWIRDKAALMPRRGNLPRGLAQMLGLAAPESSRTMQTGTDREPEIIRAWIDRLERGEWVHECEREIDPDSVQWAGALPWEWVEHADTESPLVVHPDAWAKTWRGELVTVETKCARYGYDRPAWWNGIAEPPWYYGCQLDAYHAVMRSERGILLVGGGWNRDDDDPREDGPLLALPHDRDDEAIARVRDVARRAHELIRPYIQTDDDVSRALRASVRKVNMEAQKQAPRRMTLAAVTKGPRRAPQRVVIYGTEGIGKSTWAAASPGPIFLPLEEGANALDIARFPQVRSWADVIDALDELANVEQSHPYRTVVVDTLDALEPIVWKRTCETKLNGDKRVSSIEDYGFGKGYIYALDLWRDFLARLDKLREMRGMDIILVAHAALVTVKSPDTEDWQRYDLKLDRKASAAVREWADHVLFATTAVGMQKLNQRAKVTSLGERVLHTTNAPGWVAKTRSAAPAEIPLSYEAWTEALSTRESAEALEARIESMIGSVPTEKHAAIRAAVENAKKQSDPGAALRVVANRVATTVARLEAA